MMICKVLCGVANLVLIIISVAISIGGILILVYGGSSAPKEPSYLSTYSNFLGIAVLITGLFGLVITCTIKCFLIQVFAFALVLCVLGEIALGIICTSLHRNTDRRKSNQLLQHYKNYYADSESMKIIDNIQQKYKCCGNSGLDDPMVVDTNKNDMLIPSCCPDTNKYYCTKENAFRKSCLIETVTDEKLTLQSLSIIGWFFGIVGAVSLAFVCILKRLSCFL